TLSYTLSLHDALPILGSAPVSMSPTRTDRLPLMIACASKAWICGISHCSPDRLSPARAVAVGVGSVPPASSCPSSRRVANFVVRSEEHTSELQSRSDL